MSIRAPCGINCAECPVYIATITNDRELKKEAAFIWGKDFGIHLSEKDMTCNGCGSEKTFFMCSECPILKCCEEREIKNCGECCVYPCEHMRRFLTQLPGEKTFLDRIHTARFSEENPF